MIAEFKCCATCRNVHLCAKRATCRKNLWRSRGVSPVLEGRDSMPLDTAIELLRHPRLKLLPPELVDEAHDVVAKGVHRRPL